MSSGRDEPLKAGRGRTPIAVQVAGNRRLTENTFEIRFNRPEGFDFLPGQKISVLQEDLHRDYSLVGPRESSDLTICVRKITGGALSPILAGAATGDPFHITPAFGYFLYQPSERPVVFVATGTGIAPFVAYAHDGAQGYHLLHGVRLEEELYYRDLLSKAAGTYTPCISYPKEKHLDESVYFHGRVTHFLDRSLPRGAYDFYLCGRREMLRDATRIIDQRFEGSRIFSELFF